MKGFIIIGNDTYQMVEVTPEEMDRLKKEGDTQLWPVRFDRNRRVHPVLWEYGVTIYFKDD